MADAPPEELRRRIDELADDAGPFYLACAETGETPMPVTGARFASHDDAEAAAGLARRYRDALRAVDPSLPRRRLVVAERTGDLALVSSRRRADGYRENGLPRSTRAATAVGRGTGEWLSMENAPVVHLARDEGPLDDELVDRQLDASRVESGPEGGA